MHPDWLPDEYKLSYLLGKRKLSPQNSSRVWKTGMFDRHGYILWHMECMKRSMAPQAKIFNNSFCQLSPLSKSRKQAIKKICFIKILFTDFSWLLCKKSIHSTPSSVLWENFFSKQPGRGVNYAFLSSSQQGELETSVTFHQHHFIFVLYDDLCPKMPILGQSFPKFRKLSPPYYCDPEST